MNFKILKYSKTNDTIKIFIKVTQPGKVIAQLIEFVKGQHLGDWWGNTYYFQHLVSFTGEVFHEYNEVVFPEHHIYTATFSIKK